MSFQGFICLAPTCPKSEKRSALMVLFDLSHLDLSSHYIEKSKLIFNEHLDEMANQLLTANYA